MKRFLLSLLLVLATCGYAAATDFNTYHYHPYGYLTTGVNGTTVNDQLTFYTPLTSTLDILTPPRAYPGTTATFTRASASYLTDFEGETRKVESGSVGVEGSRVVTNLFLNSGAPATQTITLPVGRYTAWLTGSGTITSAAGTAVGTGFGAATSGSHNVITITAPGTVVFTETGTATTAQVEPNTAATSTTPSEYVATTSAAVTKCFATDKSGTALPTSYPEWQASTAYAAGTKIQVSGWWYTASAGTSGGTAPTWLTGKSGLVTVTDGGVTWTLGGRLLQGYVSEGSSTNKTTAYGIIPADTLSAEKVVNGGFTAWTGDNPNSWAIVGTEGAPNYITQVGNAARMVSDATLIGISQDILTPGKVYQYSINVTAATGTAVVTGTGTYLTITSTGVKTGTFVADNTALFVKRSVGLSCDVTFTDLSVKEVTWAVGTKSFHNGSSFIQNITGLTLSGDVAAVLSIVTDQTEIERAGYANINPGFKVYKLDNSAGSVAAFAIAGGTTGNTNPHSLSVIGRATNTGKLRYDNGTSTVIFTNSQYARILSPNTTPSSATQALSLSADGGQTLYFLLPQLEELPYATSLNISLGSTRTRAGTSDSYPSTGNLRTLACSGTFEYTPNMTGGTTTRWLWGSYTDANNTLGVFVDGTNVVFRKRVGGSNYDATKALSIVAGITSRIGWRINGDGSTDVFVNNVKGTGNANTATPVLAATFKLGDDGNGANGMGGAEIRNWKSYFKVLADGRL